MFLGQELEQYDKIFYPERHTFETDSSTQDCISPCPNKINLFAEVLLSLLALGFR